MSHSIVPMYYYMLMAESNKFISIGSESLGIPNEALRDIYQLVINGNPDEVEGFPWLS